MKTTVSSRNILLSSARKLIIDRGFSAMTVEAVCKSAQVTKGSFFHHFNSKEALGEAVLEQFWIEVQTNQQQASFLQADTPLAMLLGYVDHMMETFQDPDLTGCLLAIFTLELRDTYPSIYAKCTPHFHEWKTALQQMLQTAIDTSSSKVTLDASIWAEFFISTLEGALILAKAFNDPMVTTRTLTLYRDQLRLALQD